MEQYFHLELKDTGIEQSSEKWYMVIAVYGYKQANKIGMERWVDVYQGDLGIALTDTYTESGSIE